MNTPKKVISKLKKIIDSALYTEAEKRHSMVGPAKLWKLKRDFQIQFLKNVGLKSHCYFMEIGCGTLRGGIPIIEYLEKGHYFGIESRANVLEEGKKELYEANLTEKEPVLIALEDILSVKLTQEFDYVWAFSVLIHMKDEILMGCLELVSKHLKRNGCFYANVNLGNEPDGNWQGFPVVHRSFEFYEKACAMHRLKVSKVGKLRDLGHVSGAKMQDEQEMLKISKD